MGKPIEHARSSAKKWGGKPEDYIAVHELLDSSKGAFSDLRHRALTHNAWFITTILERIFGVTIKTSSGKRVSVRDIGEQHVLEDFKGKFIPSAQDYLAEIEFQDWMNNGDGEPPPSRRKAQNLVKRMKSENEDAPYEFPFEDGDAEDVKMRKKVTQETLAALAEMERSQRGSQRSRCGGSPGMID